MPSDYKPWKKPGPQRLIVKVGLILLAAAAVWFLTATDPGRRLLDWWQNRSNPTSSTRSTRGAPSQTPSPSKPAPTDGGDHWVDGRNNDGDSFMLSHDGATKEYRLYFVDCPESHHNPYNADRIHDQAVYFDITDDEAVEIGRKAKEYTAKTLQSLPFAIHTTNEQVYDGDRYYAFIELEPGTPRARWLSQELVDRGLARIHTKGATLPTGESSRTFGAELKQRERTAKSKRQGAWGLSK